MDRLVQTLDFLLPILRLNLDAITRAIGVYLLNSLENELVEIASLKISEVLCLFENNREKDAVLPLLELLADEIPYVGMKVSLLDAFTFLTMFVQGTLVGKARLIFDWYNSSRSGILSETELRVFMTRTRNTFLRLHIIGKIENSYDDIFAIAFQARAINNNKTLLPGLSFTDFYHWFSENKLSIAINRFLQVFSRLIDLIHSLENRTNALALIFEEKEKYKLNKLPVPHYNFLGCKDCILSDEFTTFGTVVHIGQYSVSICIPNVDKATKSLYIECKKLCSLSIPFYKLAKELEYIKPTDKCCAHEYELTSYQAVSRVYPVDWRLTSHQTVRVDIVDLDPNTKYRFMIYSDIWKYPAVAVHSQMTSQQINSYTEGAIQLCVLPASLDALVAEQYLYDTPAVSACDSILFTGTVCPIGQVLRQAIKLSTSHLETLHRESMKGTGINVISSAIRFGNAIYSIAESFYTRHWSSSQRTIMGCRVITEHIVKDFVPAPSRRQLLSFIGMGPWSNCDWKAECQAAVQPTPFFTEMESELEGLYRMYVDAMLPPTRSFTIGSIQVIMMNDNNIISKSGNIKNVSPVDIPEMIFQRTSNRVIANDVQHLLLVARTPADFLEAKELWDIPWRMRKEKKDRQSRTGLGQGEVTELTGSYEIVHGEYTSTEAAARSLAQKRRAEFQGEDVVFCDLCDSLLDWLADSPSTRRVTLLSVGWANGVNFKIYRDSACAIEHECLLETRSVSQALATNDPLIRRMQSSLSVGTTLVLGMPSPLRSVVIRSASGPELGDPKSRAEFLPIPGQKPASPLISKIEKETKKQASQILRSPIHISRGPFVTDVTATSAFVTVQVHGVGTVTCMIYNIPMSANYADALTLIVSDKDVLKCIGKKSKYSASIHETSLQFYFDNLTPYSNYCITIEPVELAPCRISLFKTMCETGANTTTIVTTELTTEDLTFPCLHLAKLNEFLDNARPPALSVYFQHCEDRFVRLKKIISEIRNNRDVLSKAETVRRFRPSILAPLLSQSDVHTVRRRVAVTNFGLDSSLSDTTGTCLPTAGDRTYVHFALHAKFCRLTPMRGGIRGMLDLIAALEDVDFMEIESLVIFVSQPLVHFLRVHPLLGWTCDPQVKIRRKVIGIFLMKLLDWKSAAMNRDCEIFCVCDVDHIRCALFWRLQEFKDLSVINARYSNAEKGNKLRLGSRHCTIRHLLLPSHGNHSNPGITTCPDDPNQEYGIGDVIRYCFEAVSASTVGVRTVLPRLHMYGPHQSVEPLRLMHVIDITIPNIVKELRVNMLARHNLFIQSVANSADLIQVVTGPVIGLVNTSVAKILFEFNRDLIQVKCVIRAVGDGDEDEDVKEQVKKRARPFRAIVFSFDGLKRGKEYKIFLPGIEGDDNCLGAICTPPVNPRSLKFAVLGDDQFEDIPLLDALLRQISQQQTPDIRNLLQECVNQNVDSLLRLRQGRTSNVDKSQPLQTCNNWESLSQHLSRPLHDVTAVFHLDAHSVVTSRLFELFDMFTKQTSNFQLPIKDASFAQLLFYNQLEDCIRDTLRLMWSIPAIAYSLKSCCNIFNYHSKYLLELDDGDGDTVEEEGEIRSIAEHDDEEHKKETPDKEADTESRSVSKKATNSVRKLFGSNIQSYITSLTDFSTDVGHHSMVWKVDSLTVVLFDTVSGRMMSKKRKKNKKKLDDLKPDPGFSRSKLKIHVTHYTDGFFDDMQWNLLKNILKDGTITHLVLCCQNPFIPLWEVPEEYIPPIPSSDGQGSYMPWQPTKSDLSYFFDTLFQWIHAKKEGTRRTVSLLTCSDTAYTTQVQDLWSSSCIQQICVGKFNKKKNSKDPGHHHSTRKCDQTTIVLDDFFGQIRYSHHIQSMNEWPIDSSSDYKARVTLPSHLAEKIPDILPKTIQSEDLPVLLGFGLLRLWFDSPQAGGTWSLILPNELSLIPTDPVEEEKLAAENDEAVLTLGPVFGALYCHDSPAGGGKVADEKLVFLPVLVETDLAVELVVTALCILTSVSQDFAIQTKKGLPVILKMGPLQAGMRYQLTIKSGIANKDDFRSVITTCVHKSETNVVILNHYIRKNTQISSEFINDITSRAKVPYSGLNAVLHMNIRLSLHKVILAFRDVPNINDLIMRAYNAKEASWVLRRHLRNLLERMRDNCRDIFTRPSVRALYKNSYNLFMLAMEDQKYIYYGDDSPVEILFGLLATRVLQEYVYQFTNCKREDYFYAVEKWEVAKVKVEVPVVHVETVEEINEKKEAARKGRSVLARAKLQQKAAAASVPSKTPNSEASSISPPIVEETTGPERIVCDSSLSPLDAVLSQWFSGLRPAPMKWAPWRSANGLVVIDQCCAATNALVDELCATVEREVISNGTRIVVLDGDGEESGADELLNESAALGLKFQKSVSKWSRERFHKSIFFACPSLKDGTCLRMIRRLPDGTTTPVMMVAPVFHSINQLEQVVDRKQMPKDGYGIIQSIADDFTMLEEGEERKDFFAIVSARFINSIPKGSDPKVELEMYEDVDGDRPAPADFLQLPDWLVALSPASPGTLVRDEVILHMRNREDYQALLERIESNDMFADFLNAYNDSVLCELSEEVSSRDVDLSTSESVKHCLLSVVEKIWSNSLSPDLQRRMMALCDDWLVSYIVTHLQPARISFPSAIAFGNFMTQAMTLSAALYVAYEMHKDKHMSKYVVNRPEFPMVKSLDDESDLDFDSNDEEEEEDEQRNKKIEMRPVRERDGEAPRKYATSTQDRYYTAKNTMKDLKQQRIARRRFYAEKFNFK